MIGLLAPIFRGALAPHGEALVCGPPPAWAIPVAALTRADGPLQGILVRYADHLGGGEDLRPVASLWSLAYLRALLPPMVAAASVLRHGFPATAAEVWLELDPHREPLRFYIAHEGASRAGTDTQARYAPLLQHHLEPLFAELSRISGLPRKVLWGNAARCLEPVFDQALAMLGPVPALLDDRRQLLELPLWNQCGEPAAVANHPNPLYPRLRAQAHFTPAEAANLHRQCCLQYLLPQTGYCGACPLRPAPALSAATAQDSTPA
ncbi:ferric iron reductase protein FhuF [Duganella sp. CF517]|uniref:siderophore-iron reductase FhuF n=1 Tax=Duganella sp. CF517 TaxID=1881038 RepID=UPI0008CB77DB|nr:siderophore-iron reductase FhuF [Duganella sp. CF517]SEN93561.1 ferric iron reductase protein FhuF [Duganella sp. CF517]